MKIVVDQRQQLLAGRMGFLQIRHEVVLALLLRLLHQHLGIADDQIQRRAQVVDQARWQRVPGRFAGRKIAVRSQCWLPGGSHRRPPLKSASILASRRGSSTGLVS